MKKRYLIVISVFIFFLFLILYLANSINNIDNYMYDMIIKIKSDSMTKFMKFITFFASQYFIIVLMIIFFILSFIKGKIYNVINLLIIIESLLNRIIKVIVKRERPILINLVEESSFSFPSGHTMVAVTLYGFIIYLIYKSDMKKYNKNILSIILIILIILIIISRVYLGVHYFSDVFAGLFISLAFLLFSIGVMERKKIL